MPPFTAITPETRKDLASRGFSRRHFGRIATVIGGAAGRASLAFASPRA